MTAFGRGRLGLGAATLFGLVAVGVAWLGEPSPEAPAPRPPEPAERPDPIVFRATRYHTKGACVRIGSSIAMPRVTGFEVTEVVRGELTARRVEVRPLSGDGHLDGPDGESCTLRLTPPGPIDERLRQSGDNGLLWVDGDELELATPGRKD